MKAHAPIHPGEILAEDFLEPFGMSQYLLAKLIGVSPRRINEIVLGKRAVTADTSLRLARVFRMDDDFFLNIQKRYELELERDRIGDDLNAITPYEPAQSPSRKTKVS